MSAISSKNNPQLDYELISDKFFETDSIHNFETKFDDFPKDLIDKTIWKISNKKLVDTEKRKPSDYSNVYALNNYQNTYLPYGYTLLISRLDEIENLIKTNVASKTDISKSKDEIIYEQRVHISETKKYISQLIVLLEKKSTPRIFSIISFIGLIISGFLLLISIIFGDLIFTTMHFTLSAIGFILMFIMSYLSNKIIFKAR